MTAAGDTDVLARGLAREVLASEILRGRVLAVVLTTLLGIVTFGYLTVDVAIRPFVVRLPPWWLPAVVVGPFVLYECVFIAAMTAFARRGRSPPEFAKYGNALVETSFPRSFCWSPAATPSRRSCSVAFRRSCISSSSWRRR